MLTVLQGGEVYSPAPLGLVDVVISAGKVIAVGTGLGSSLHTSVNDVDTIDCSGLIVTPGLIDSHCHPLGGGDLAGPSGRRDPLHADDFLAHGITTAVGVLAADYHGRTIEGLVIKGRELTEAGLGFRFYSGSVATTEATATGSVSGDVLLIEQCAGIKLAIAEPMCSESIERKATAAIEAARAALMVGKTPRVHLHVGGQPTGLDELYELIDRTGLLARVFQPTHINRSSPDLMKAALPLLEAGGFVDLTATLPLGGGKSTRLEIVDALRRLLDSGAPLERITFSSDGNVTLPVRDCDDEIIGTMPAGIDTLANAWRDVVGTSGLTFEQALQPVTINPACALGLHPAKGVIEPGADADIVAWEEQMQPKLVMAGGRIWAGGSARN